MEQRQKAVNDILQRDSLAFRPKISKRSVFDGEVCMFVLFVVCCLSLHMSRLTIASGGARVHPQQRMPLQEIRVPEEVL